MPQDRTNETMSGTLSGSGQRDGDAWLEQHTPTPEIVPEAERPAEDCDLDDDKAPSDDMGERLTGDDRTINKP